jgi:excinuclease ABC subunit B
MDNRPLTFDEFYSIVPQTVYVSATPADFEINDSEGLVVEQLIRPTGLLDPVIEVRPCQNQVDDLLDEIDKTIKMGDRVLVTTLTKRMAEELTKYLTGIGIKTKYIHSEVKTLDRVEILRELRLGVIDVLVGINLLREGLDLPEVSFVAIMDADKEGFLRSVTSLVQTIGRAARNDRGKVIMYADRITDAMSKTIEETERRREKQMEYNTAHGIVPKTVSKSNEMILKQTSVADSIKHEEVSKYEPVESISMAADPTFNYMSKKELEKAAKETEKAMMRAAKEMEFMEAARLRDQWEELKERIKVI